MPLQATTTTPLFAAVLTPNRSLSARGAWILAGLAAILLLSPGLLFLSMGAWPVTALMGLTTVAILVALVTALRRNKRREKITVWSDQIEWQVTDSAGATELRRFDPRQVRLMLSRDEHEKTIAVRLRDESGGYDIGSFLTSEHKSSFAKALGTALRRARS
ncbi:MAG: DUF2244 domain-containing protein [Devosia sp.]